MASSAGLVAASALGMLAGHGVLAGGAVLLWRSHRSYSDLHGRPLPQKLSLQMLGYATALLGLLIISICFLLYIKQFINQTR